MIVREIVQDTHGILNNFDWFNDYDDTRLWLREQNKTLLIELLDAGFRVWLKKDHDDFYKRQAIAKTQESILP
jgi:hypothetical protein